MIYGTNSSSLGLSDSEFDDYAYTIENTGSVDSVLKNLKERKQNILNGGINCIPLPFQRFRIEIPGIEQGQYILVTANQKVGKTNFADFVYVFHALDYAYEYPDRCSVHIIYVSLEEAIQKVIERYMSYLLYKLDGIRVSPTDLRSTSRDYPISDDILDKFETEPYKKRLEFFEKCVQFETENTNPTGILRVCEQYAKTVGKYNTHKIISNGVSKNEIEVFDSYEQNDKNHYKILIVDHIGLVDKEQGFRIKDAVDKMSEYCVKYLRNRYNYTCVAIQQQASESEGLEAIKQKKMIPSSATLGDSKYTARDVDLALGLFDPSKFGLSSWLGYTIQDDTNMGLKNFGRFLYVLANRNGNMGGICPLFFDGAVCNFEELPKPDDISGLTQYYTRVKDIKSYRQQHKMNTLMLFTLFKKLLNK